MTSDVTTTRRRRLTGQDRRAIWEREHGHCMLCGVKLQVGRFVFEHCRALELGGTDTPDNIRLTCLSCAREKTRDDHRRAAKAKRQKIAGLGLKPPSHRPIPGSRASGWKHRMDGSWERR